MILLLSMNRHYSFFYPYTRHPEEKQKKHCRLEFYQLVKKSVEFEISSDVFTETLNSLVKNDLYIVNIFKNGKFISLLK